MANNLLISLALSSLVAATGGLVGAFALMRRMTLAADPISHIALPGIGLAILFHLNPLVGGSFALIFGAFFIWFLEERSRINIEAVIGVVFAAALAIGAIVTPQEDLIEALFGSLKTISPLEFWGAVVVAALIVGCILKFRHEMAITLISPDLARASGIKTRVLNLAFLLTFVLAIILGLRFIGALLMGSLIIIPAVTARKLASSFSSFLAYSAGAAISANLLGALVSVRFGWELGPSVVAVASLFFLVATLVRR